MPPAGAEADFLAVLPADELTAGAVAAAAEVVPGAEVVAGAEAVVAAAEDFRLLVFAAGTSEPLDAGSEVAVGVASALADFLLRLVFFAVVASDDPDAFAGAADSAVESALAAFLLVLLFLAVVASEVPAAGADSAVESALADFLLLLLFLAVVVSDEPALLVEAEVWSAASLPEDFFWWLDLDLLELDLLELEEVSVPLASEPVLVSDFVLFLDFLLDACVSLPAVAWSSLALVSFFDFFLVLLVDDAVWSSVEPLWVCAIAGATPSPNSRHTPTATVSTLILSVLIPIPSLDFVLGPTLVSLAVVGANG